MKMEQTLNLKYKVEFCHEDLQNPQDFYSFFLFGVEIYLAITSSSVLSALKGVH